MEPLIPNGRSPKSINANYQPHNGYNPVIHSTDISHHSHAGADNDDTDYVELDEHEDQLSIHYEQQQEEEKQLNMYNPNDRHARNNGADEDETTLDPTTAVFDDLEFLHDFLEHEAQKSFFESNCFQCNYKNLCKLVFLLLLVAVALYIVYHFYDDYLNAHWLELLKLASIPLICIAFTYGHIALALWMTFWPVEFFPHKALQFKSGPFKGYGFGWQGIVPMKAVKMAQIAVDLMVPDVVRMEDVVAKIDPTKVSEIVEPALLQILKILIPRVAAKQAPIGWALLPEAMKQKMISVAIEDSHTSVENMIADINENIEEIFDLTEFVSNALRTDKELLSKIFLKCGRKELIFIRNFGGFMGLVFGLLQMVAQMYWKGNYWFDHLMLPISGFLLGWITNWIALKLIFRPIEPIIIPCCCPLRLCFGDEVKLQGLFLKRQREVSVEFAAFITKKILRAEYILAAMYSGPSSDRLFVKITKHLQDACDRFAGYEKFTPLIEFALGSDRFKQAKQEVVDGLFNCMELRCSAEIVRVQKKLEQYTDEAMDIERLLRTKMAQLTSQQFEGVLHPVFEQDEIKLIMIGAILGLLVGLFQVYVIKN